MATSGGSSGAIHAPGSGNSSTSGSGGGNPRKFAEKIQILTIKGAEDTAEFEKIMSECAAVKVGHQQVDNSTAQHVNGPKVTKQTNIYIYIYIYYMPINLYQ